MVLFPNAKINLGLHITHKRIDGFHDIETVFYPVSWNDVLEVMPTTSTSQFRLTGAEIPDDGKENLCMRAYRLLSQDFGLPPVDIYLHKIIPTGAGLGGGSSDAAHVLLALNRLFALRLSNAQLQGYASMLGSDCAFFVQNTPCLGTGKGDILSPLLHIGELLRDKYFVLVYPALNIGTAEAYRGVKPDAGRPALREIIQAPLTEWRHHLHNDFERHLFAQYPVLAHTKDTLYGLGAVYASLSGSGSTVFGIFEQPIQLPESIFPSDYQVHITPQNGISNP